MISPLGSGESPGMYMLNRRFFLKALTMGGVGLFVRGGGGLAIAQVQLVRTPVMLTSLK